MKNILVLLTILASKYTYSNEYLIQFRSDEKNLIKIIQPSKKLTSLNLKNTNVYSFNGSMNELQQLELNFNKNNIDFKIEKNIKLELLEAQSPEIKTDNLFKKQWHLENTAFNARTTIIVPGVKGEDIDAKKAWNISTGSKEVKIALVDSGIDYNHPDLKGNVWANQDELNGKPGIDDDGNGYIDDIYGYDFINDDNNPIDEDGHGSHCAGIIGAVHGNGGIMGVMGKVRIMPLKFSTGGAGTMESALKAIDYAIEHNADIISNSWGGAPKESILFDLLNEASKKGIFIVNAAGNSGNSSERFPVYPASYDIPGLMSVGATMGRGSRANFSNYGETTVDVFAPGYNIYSTWINGKYRKKSGTSMAAPIVAGLAGLALSVTPSLSPEEIKANIIKSSEKLKSLEGKSVGGRVNAYYLLQNLIGN